MCEPKIRRKSSKLKFWMALKGFNSLSINTKLTQSSILNMSVKYLSNQASVGLWLAHNWLRTSVYVCVCVSTPRLLITSGVMSHDMSPI